MKKIYYSLLIVIFAFVVSFTSCNDATPELIYSEIAGESFVVFFDTTATIVESGGDTTINLVVTRAGTADYSAAVDVEYTISIVNVNDGSDATGKAIITPEFGEAGRLTIPAGSASANINITAVDNDVIDGSKLVTVTLTSTTATVENLGFPGTGNGVIYSLNIGDDDFFCTRNILANVITQETDVGFGSAPVNIELSGEPGAGCLTFAIQGAASSFFGSPPPSQFEITLIEDSPGSDTGTVQSADDVPITSFETGGPITNGGIPLVIDISNGTYDLVAGTIQFDYVLQNANGATFFGGTLLYD